ncbi:chitotriosidase-1-like isoform X2 [Biomphalaria glabrata]|uniref:Chitotriosidase-1-like isoform X2 n=1 Tax=Biomphalaria glabrata TaxID=6526 RepID=A0A9W2YJG0_BIOGL|nr:chitotriosidase-1-like isoform X2 [Biomphalaria glabrata]
MYEKSRPYCLTVGFHRTFHCLQTLRSLKQSNPQFKVILQLINWISSYDSAFDQMVNNHNSRYKFYDNVVNFLRANSFDGIEIRQRFEKQSRPLENKDWFIVVLQALANKFVDEGRSTKREKLLLLVPLTLVSDLATLEARESILGISRAADLVIMDSMYFVRKSVVEPPRHHTALYGIRSSDERTINYVANFLTARGCPKEKLIISVSATVFAYTAIDDSYINIWTTTYDKICSMISRGYRVYRNKDNNPEIDGPDIFNVREAKEEFRYFYEDPSSLGTKIRYIKEKGFAGISVWGITDDDFKNICRQGRYPLLNAVKAECR